MSFIMQEQRAAQRHANSSMRHAGVTPGGNSQIALGDGSSMSESFRQSGGGGYGRPAEAPQMRGAEGYRPNYAAFAHGGLQSSSTELGGPQQVGRSSTRLHAPPGGSSQIVFG